MQTTGNSDISACAKSLYDDKLTGIRNGSTAGMNGQNENSSINVRGRSNDDRTASPSSTKRFFKVLWTKYAPNKKRKNKSFADGFLTCVDFTPDKAPTPIAHWVCAAGGTRTKPAR